MSKQRRYNENEKVEYYILRDGKRVHRIGYVKGRKRMLWCVRYFICAADRSKDIDIVKPSQIFGVTDYDPAKKKTSKQIINIKENGD